MFYYTYRDSLFISIEDQNNDLFTSVTEEYCKTYKGYIYVLTKMNSKFSRRSFIINHPSLLFAKEESIDLLSINNKCSYSYPQWLINAINEERVLSLNTNYFNYLEVLNNNPSKKKWNVNVVGLGDVGATLLTGLKLLGNDCIETLGIFDLDKNKVERLNFELNQILSCDGKENSMKIIPIEEKNLFNCDMFVFCVSVGIPPIGKEDVDVRLVQFEGNRKVLKHYGTLARNSNYKGIFAVVSDPVDLLCMSLFEDTNKDCNNNWDFKGLAPEQIKGYGLGVMNARAVYYSSLREDTKSYIKEGRAFGPHGEGLIIANSIENYDDEISDYLTQKTKSANLDVRATGFKPYIAPSLSSGALSLIDTIKGNYHYSANFINGVYMGSKNKLIHGCTENELLTLPNELICKLHNTFDLLKSVYANSNNT